MLIAGVAALAALTSTGVVTHAEPALATAPSVHVPLYFEENVGQADASVGFVAHANGYRSLLTPTDNVMVFSAGDRRDAIAMRLVGARAAVGQPFDPLRSFSAYFRGNDSSRWRTHVPHYAKVRYPNVYDGIDLVYYGRGRDLEYDFIVRPDADPAQIRVAFRGAKSSTLTARGDLRLQTTVGEMRQRKPHVYQVIDGVKKEVSASQRIDGDTIAFAIDDYDRRRDLIVDPVLEWSTYLGGGTPSGEFYPAFDDIAAISVSADKSIYVAGATASADFPVLNPLDDTASHIDAFVSKFVQDPALGLPTLAWSTYVGGFINDGASGLAIRPGGAVYLVGTTYSSDFPTLFPFQAPQPVFDAFVTRLQETGDQLSLVWSTFLGGTGDDYGQAIDVDAAENVYVAGYTKSASFPLVRAFQGDQPGDDVFVTKFNAFTGTNLTVAYSTYLGGNGTREIPAGLRVDASGAAYVVGETNSSNFPTVNALAIQPTFRTGFVTKLRARPIPTVTLEWSTLLGGGNGDTVVNAIALDGGAVFIAGQTSSPTFPVVNGFQTHQGSIDAFLARIDQTSPLTLAWSSHYGGSNVDIAADIAVDRSGAIYIAGHTRSFELPLFNPTQQLQGFVDAFVARFVVGPGGGPDLVGATLVGGTGKDGVDRNGAPYVNLALDVDAGIYLAGTTDSPDFPGANPADYRADFDGFITKLRNDPVGITLGSSPAGLAFTSTGATGCVPGTFTTPRTLFMTPIPSTACQIALSSIYALGTGSRLRFRQWSDAFLSPVPQLSFDVPDFPTESLSVTALYTTQHQLLSSVTPAGSGSIAPASGQFFDAGTTVQLTATAAACFAFNAWSVNAPNGLATMAAPQQVTARFVGNGASALGVSIAAGPMTNIAAGRYRQTLTIRNNGAAVTDARLVINNLTAGFTVLNANGTTSCSSTGRPFLSIPPPFGQQSVTIDFFRFGAIAPPTYTPSVIANGQP
jgi:hypothetical protein